MVSFTEYRVGDGWCSTRPWQPSQHMSVALGDPSYYKSCFRVCVHWDWCVNWQPASLIATNASLSVQLCSKSCYRLTAESKSRKKWWSRQRKAAHFFPIVEATVESSLTSKRPLMQGVECLLWDSKFFQLPFTSQEMFSLLQCQVSRSETDRWEGGELKTGEVPCGGSSRSFKWRLESWEMEQ